MISTYLGQKWLNMIRGVAYTAPATVYVALYNTTPTRSAPGVEPTDAAYARKPITLAAATESSGKSTVSNTAEITFAAATQNWGTITHFGIVDALTGGNVLFADAVGTPKTIETDDQLKIQVGELKATLE